MEINYDSDVSAGSQALWNRTWSHSRKSSIDCDGAASLDLLFSSSSLELQNPRGTPGAGEGEGLVTEISPQNFVWLPAEPKFRPCQTLKFSQQ